VSAPAVLLRIWSETTPHVGSSEMNTTGPPSFALAKSKPMGVS
jgi:hypothetical protein